MCLYKCDKFPYFFINCLFCWAHFDVNIFTSSTSISINVTIIDKTINIIIQSNIPVFQFWSCYVGCTGQYKDAVRMSLDQLDVIKKFVSKYPDTFKFETTAKGMLVTPLGKPFLVFPSLLFFLSLFKLKIFYIPSLSCLQPRELYKITVELTVGFIVLQYSVVCTVESLSFFYPLFIS